MKGIPYDLDSVDTDWSDEILSKVRSIRKQYVLPAKSNPKNLDVLKEGKKEIGELERRVDELMEEYGEGGGKSQEEKELIEERKSKKKDRIRKIR